MPQLPVGISADDEAKVIIADRLRSLGWSVEKIQKILRGPEYHSIDEIASKQTKGQIESPPTEQDGALLPHAEDNELGTAQKETLDSLWALFHGDPTRVMGIVSSITQLPGEMQAYLVAAIFAGQSALGDVGKWLAGFDADAKARRARLPESQREKDRVAELVLSAGAKASSEIPVIGEDISKLLSLGLAIREALLWSLPMPVVNAADVAEEVEGDGVRLGLDVMGRDPALVDADPVASLLPVPPPRMRYPFVPSLAEFQTAAIRLGLYADQANSVVPPAGRYRWTIKSMAGTDGLKDAHVFLSVHGLDASMDEIEITNNYAARIVQGDSEASGIFRVKDSLGDIQTGSLRMDKSGSAGWTIDWVRITSLLDGSQWKASSVGSSDDDGQFSLLKFEEVESPEEEAADSSEDGSDDETSAPTDEGSTGIVPPDAQKPALQALLDEFLAGTKFSGTPQTTPPSEGTRTYEIYGQMGEERLPLNAVYSEDAGLARGGRVFIGDDPADGYGYAGVPGRGLEVFGNVSPAEYGLDVDKPIVIYDGNRAWPVHANYLTSLYGVSWRKVVYQQ